LYNLKADSFIGGNRLPRENHHPAIFFCRRLMAYNHYLSLMERIGLSPG